MNFIHTFPFVLKICHIDEFFLLYFKAVLKRKQYEEKFDVDVTDDPITGETKVKDRAKDEVLVLFESF